MVTEAQDYNVNPKYDKLRCPNCDNDNVTIFADFTRRSTVAIGECIKTAYKGMILGNIKVKGCGTIFTFKINAAKKF